MRAQQSGRPYDADRNPSPRGALPDVQSAGKGRRWPTVRACEVPARLARHPAAPAEASLRRRCRDSNGATQAGGSHRQALMGLALTCLFDSKPRALGL